MPPVPSTVSSMRRQARLVTTVCLAFAMLLSGSVADAQTVSPASPVPSRTLTLDEALSLAETTSEQVAIAAAGLARAEGGRQLARSERFPQLAGLASYDRTIKSEFEGLFDTGAGGGEDVDFSDLPFGQANVYRLGLSFSQLLYTGGRIRAQERQAALRRDNATLNLSSARAQTTLDVAQAFYDAALADRFVAIAEEAFAQADRALQVTQEQRVAGRVSEFELLRAQVARDSLQPSVVRARNTRDVMYLQLKQLLDLPLEQPLALTADLEDAMLVPPTRFAERLAEAEAGVAATTRLAISQLGNQVRISEQEIAIAGAERRPSIGLRSDYGLVDYPGSVPNFTDWRQNWTVGVGLTLPIFDGGRIAANQAIARAGAQESRAQLRLTEELAALDAASTRQDVVAARAEWEATAGTIQQAQRAYEIAELRYTEGLSTQLELSDARLQLARSLATRAEAARNLQVQRIRFALLPELPLGDGALRDAPPTAATAAPQTQTRTQTAPARGAVGTIPGTGGGR